MMKRLVCAAFAAVLLITLSLAQNPPGPPKPAPELQRVNYFAGSWKMSGNMNPGPFGPGGKFTGTEHNAWDLDGFFMVSRSTFNGGGMNGKGVAYFGYDANKKVYTYDEYNSMGQAEHSTGMLDDKTWKWTSENDMGGKHVNSRFTLVETSPASYTMKFEYSTDGGNTWSTAMEGTGTKEGAGGGGTKKGEKK